MIDTSERLTFDEEQHEYRLDDVVIPSVTQVLKSAGIVDDRWFTEWARDRGSAAHKMLQFYDEGDLDMSSVDPRLRPYLDGYLNFLNETRFKPNHIELPVVSLLYGYAGTLDRQGVMNGGNLAIIDIKTGKPSRATQLQLTAYQEAFFELYGVWCPDLYGVHLDEDGGYRVSRYANDKDTWRAALAVAKWKERGC
jgi:hypothetical protein